MHVTVTNPVEQQTAIIDKLIDLTGGDGVAVLSILTATDYAEMPLDRTQARELRNAFDQAAADGEAAADGAEKEPTRVCRFVGGEWIPITAR